MALSQDGPNRRVLFAVELVDPVAQATVSRGMTVRLGGVSSLPVVNASGRFVWLAERDSQAWPTTIVVTSDGAPFASELVRVRSPRDRKKPTPEERLGRVRLRPTPAYPFEAGVTASRGRLTESERSPLPVVGALAQLAWFDEVTGKWVPPLPKIGSTEEGDPPPTPPEVETDARGEFAVFARMTSTTSTESDLEGQVKVRMQFTRLREGLSSRVTPPDFPFVPGKPDGCMPEGRLLPRDLQLRWSDLVRP